MLVATPIQLAFALAYSRSSLYHISVIATFLASVYQDDGLHHNRAELEWAILSIREFDESLTI